MQCSAPGLTPDEITINVKNSEGLSAGSHQGLHHCFAIDKFAAPESFERPPYQRKGLKEQE